LSTHLLDREGTSQPRADRTSVESYLRSGEFFWLDLHEPTEEDYRVLREVFGFHPLAVEDSEHFGQRPKLEFVLLGIGLQLVTVGILLTLFKKRGWF
jgi:Mg2+ and Co2+ transporter CorA